MLKTLSYTKNIYRGIINNISNDGITVFDASLDDEVICDVLRTSTGPMPVYKNRDAVLFVPPEYPGDRGCVCGIIETYKPDKERTNLLSPKYPIKNEKILDINGEIISINAEKGINIKCGKGSITITKDGRIKVDGTNLTNRARGVNKIKGASVKIN